MPPEKKEQFKKEARGKSNDDILNAWVNGRLKYHLDGEVA